MVRVLEPLFPSEWRLMIGQEFCDYINELGWVFSPSEWFFFPKYLSVVDLKLVTSGFCFFSPAVFCSNAVKRRAQHSVARRNGERVFENDEGYGSVPQGRGWLGRS